MTNIEITRSHRLGYERAMQVARVLVVDLARKYNLSYEWSGSRAVVKHGGTGIKGALEISAESVAVFVKLNFLQSVFKRVIESTVHDVLNKELG